LNDLENMQKGEKKSEEEVYDVESFPNLVKVKFEIVNSLIEHA